MIVSAAEISPRTDDHVTSRNGDVRIPAQIVRRIRPVGHKLLWTFLLWNPAICSLSVVDAIVLALTERKLCHGAFGVIGNRSDVLREERLVLLMNPRCQVRPPQEGLRIRRPVVKADAQFEICFPRPQAN